MSRYLLDTNMLSALVRDPRGAVRRRIAERGEARVCTSVVVAAELRYGARKKKSSRLSAQLERILGALEVLPLEVPVDEIYGRLRVELESAGQPIGSNDLFIAAHALAEDCTLVTDDEREFGRVRGLSCENWLR